MKVIAIAMEHEAAGLLAHVAVKKETRFGYARALEIDDEGRLATVLIFGVGKVHAAAGVAAFLASHSDVDSIISVGVGGSLDAKKAPLLSAILGSDFLQHDVDTSALGDPIGMVSGENLVRFPASQKVNEDLQRALQSAGIPFSSGTISSGDSFIAGQSQKETIVRNFASLSCDMESAAVAQVAYEYGVPFGGFRIVSDTGHPGEYQENVARAEALLSKALLAYVAQ